MNFGTYFNGRNIIHPGAYDYIDSTGMISSTPGSPNVPIMLGESETGTPGEVVWFTDPIQAKKHLTGGDLYTAIDLVFSPLPEGGGGCSRIGVLTVNPLTQAKLEREGLVYTSRVYGEPSNKVYMSLSDGTITGSKKAVIGNAETNLVEIFDNIGCLFAVKYTGTEEYASMELDSTNPEDVKLVVKTGATQESATLDLEVSLKTYDTVSKVVSFISKTSGYEARFLSSKSVNMSVGNLDKITGVNIKGTEGIVTSLIDDLVNTISSYSQLITCSVKTRTTPIVNFGSTSLRGGSKGESPRTWSSQFEHLKSQVFNRLILLTSLDIIHAEALSFISTMESKNVKIVAFSGGGTDDDKTTMKQRSSLLNSSRMVLAYPPIYHPSYEEGKAKLPGYMTGAMIAGRSCGVPPSEPITFDYFNVVKLGDELIHGDTEIDDLIAQGICTLEKAVNGGIRLAHGRTTYIGPYNLMLTELSLRTGGDAVSEFVRQGLEKAFVGTKSVPNIVTAIVTATKDLLDMCKRNNDITSYNADTITVRKSGTAYMIDYEASIGDPINYLLITSHFVPDSI